MTSSVTVQLRQLDPGLPLPAYAHPGDAGADLVAAEDVGTGAGGAGAGAAPASPSPSRTATSGWCTRARGWPTGSGVTVLNAPGTVDAGYRGEILVNLVNHDRVITAKISRGDRIAQLVVQRVERADFVVVDELPDTARGAGGHGSTGGHAGLVTAVHLEET